MGIASCIMKKTRKQVICMDDTGLVIRPAAPEDAGALGRIYGWYVENTAITFEYTAPTEQAFAERIRSIGQKYPYLVAQRGENILGYAYATAYIARAACDWSCEVSIYLAPEATKQGVGRMLYERLEQLLKAMGIVNMYASIACGQADDPYVSENSADFHKHMGFAPVGIFCNCGYKFGRWYHLQWMEKTLAAQGADMPPVRWFSREEMV